MKRSSIALVFVLGCISGGVAGRMADSPASAQAPGARVRWEYNCDVNPSLKQLDDAGANGWELVTTSTVLGNGDINYCFKRPLS